MGSDLGRDWEVNDVIYFWPKEYRVSRGLQPANGQVLFFPRSEDQNLHLNTKISTFSDLIKTLADCSGMRFTTAEYIPQDAIAYVVTKKATKNLKGHVLQFSEDLVSIGPSTEELSKPCKIGLTYLDFGQIFSQILGYDLEIINKKNPVIFRIQ